MVQHGSGCLLWILHNRHMLRKRAELCAQLWTVEACALKERFLAHVTQPAQKSCLLPGKSYIPGDRGAGFCLWSNGYGTGPNTQDETLRCWDAPASTMCWGLLDSNSSCLPDSQSFRLFILPHSLGEEQRAKEHHGQEVKKNSCKELIRESWPGTFCSFPVQPSSICWNHDQTACSGDSRVREINEL